MDARVICAWLMERTVQRPLEQLVERLLLCHGCLLCLLPPLLAASVCCGDFGYTSIFRRTLVSCLLTSTTALFAQQHLDVILSHAAVSKREPISARARWDIDGQIEATRLV